MINGRISYKIKLPGHPTRSAEADVTCDNGVWCLVTAERNGNVAYLKVNDRMSYMQISNASLPQLLLISNSEQYQLYFGGVPERLDTRTDTTQTFMGCVDDLRYNGNTILVNQSTNSVAQNFVDNVLLGCRSTGCIRPSVCPPNLYCDDLWDAHRCIDICRSRNPCQNNGTCSIVSSQYQCSCHNGYFGLRCQFGGPAAQMQEILTYSAIGGGAALALLFIVIIYLVLQSRSKRNIRQKLEYAKKGNANIATYRIEGGGEDDVDNYDINILKNPLPDSISSLPIKIPISPSNSSKKSYIYHRQSANGNVLIKNGLATSRSADPDELMKRYMPEDSIKYFADEGKSTPAGSLSSLEVVEDDDAIEDDQSSFTYLNVWGPRFKRLADIYNTPSVEDVSNKSENI